MLEKMNSAVMNNQADCLKGEGKGALNKRNDVKANELMMINSSRGASRKGKNKLKKKEMK